MYLKLPDLNIPALVDCLMKVLALESVVALQAHLSEETLAGIG